MSPDPDSHNVLIDGSRRFRLPDVGYQPMIGEYTNLDPGIRWYLERDPADLWIKVASMMGRLIAERREKAVLDVLRNMKQPPEVLRRERTDHRSMLDLW